MNYKPYCIAIILLLVAGASIAQPYKAQLDKLNAYLSTYAPNQVLQQFVVEKDSIYLINDGERYYGYHKNDIVGASINYETNTVSVGCKEGVKCIENVSPLYKLPDMRNKRFENNHFFVKRMSGGVNTRFNFEELANLINQFIYAVKKELIPSNLVFDEKLYTEFVNNAKDSIAWKAAKTPLEKAVLEFSFFIKNAYFTSSSPFKGATLQKWGDVSMLELKNSASDDVLINLNDTEGLMLYKAQSGNTELVIYPKPGKQSYKDYMYRKEGSWFFASEKDAKSCYLLLGNLLEAFKSQQEKGYKPTLSYQQRLEYLKTLQTPIIIEKQSTILLKNATKSESDYKSIRKLIGQERVVDNALRLNPDLKTYNGKIDGYYPDAFAIELEFVSGPPALTQEQKTKLAMDSLMDVQSKEHLRIIKNLSRETLEADNKFYEANGLTLIEEQIVMVDNGLNTKDVYGGIFKLEYDQPNVFVIRGFGMNKVLLYNFGYTPLNVPAKPTDHHIMNAIPDNDGKTDKSKINFMIGVKQSWKGTLGIDLYGVNFQFAIIRKYAKVNK